MKYIGVNYFQSHVGRKENVKRQSLHKKYIFAASFMPIVFVDIEPSVHIFSSSV